MCKIINLSRKRKAKIWEVINQMVITSIDTTKTLIVVTWNLTDQIRGIVELIDRVQYRSWLIDNGYISEDTQAVTVMTAHLKQYMKDTQLNTVFPNQVNERRA